MLEETVEQRIDKVIKRTLDTHIANYIAANQTGRERIADTVQEMLRFLIPTEYDTYWAYFREGTQ